MAQHDYQSYTNNRFHFSIDYPAALLTPEEAPTNGDGRTFSNDEASLSAWGNLFLEDIYPDMQAVFENATENHDITYQVLNDDFFVVSGFTPEGKVFYRRADLLEGVIYNFLIEYPQTRNYIYDTVTTQVADSYTLPIASYDCNLASTESEKLICGTSRLSLYDARIAKSYGYLQETLPPAFSEQLKIQQRAWLQRRDACNALGGETIFVCHSEEMFSRADYLSVLEHIQEDFVNETSNNPVDDISCEEALTKSADDFLAYHQAFATLPFAGYLNHWSYCFAEQAFLKHALSTSAEALNNFAQLRRTLLDLMGAYNALRSYEAGGGSMYIMFYARGHQWVETEFAYSLDSYSADPYKIPEKVLKRAGLPPTPVGGDELYLLERKTLERKALEEAHLALEQKLQYTADYLINCCEASQDQNPGDQKALEQAAQAVKDNLYALVEQALSVDLYVAHEVLALADDMYSWFDAR